MKYWAAALMAISAFHASAEMTGNVRHNFVSSFSRSCFEHQRSAPANRQVTDSLLREYCACSSEIVARRMSNDEVIRIEAGKQNPDKFIAAINESAKHCQEKLLVRR